MKILILRPRHTGYRHFLAMMYRSCLGNIGLWEFKLRYGLVSLPWWLRRLDMPIIDPRRLLTAGTPQWITGVDTGGKPNIRVTETWAAPSKEFPMGGYKLVVDGKVMTACGEFSQEGVPGSPYWHGGPPFVMYDEIASWPEGWKDEEREMLRHEVAWDGWQQGNRDKLCGRPPQTVRALLEDKNVDVVHAPRQSRKSSELLRYVRDRHGAEAIIVYPNRDMAEFAMRTALWVWHERAPGVEIEYVDQQPRVVRGEINAQIALPRFVSPPNGPAWLSRHVCGQSRRPIFVDEWNRLRPKDQTEIVETGWFVKAVTS